MKLINLLDKTFICTNKDSNFDFKLVMDDHQNNLSWRFVDESSSKYGIGKWFINGFLNKEWYIKK